VTPNVTVSLELPRQLLFIQILHHIRRRFVQENEISAQWLMTTPSPTSLLDPLTYKREISAPVLNWIITVQNHSQKKNYDRSTSHVHDKVVTEAKRTKIIEARASACLLLATALQNILYTVLFSTVCVKILLKLPEICSRMVSVRV